jgi:DNA invertase Pin-like site-specific DNA recombinase
MKRIAIYARVSTTNHGQTTETQLLPLRQYAAARGLDIVEEYCDTGISGTKDKRPALDRLMKDAHARKFDAVAVFRFDRFGRSTSHLLRSLETFQSLGIDFVSMSESIDTSTPTGKLMFSLLSAFAEFERGIIVERINAGLDRCRRKGIKLGRKEVIVSKTKVAEYRSKGRSYAWIADILGVSVGKVHAIAKSA